MGSAVRRVLASCILVLILLPGACGGDGENGGVPGGTHAEGHRTQRAGSSLPATDSGAAATAMATGCKTRAGRISWSGDLRRGELENLGELLGARDWSVGIVSTVPFSHATPACFVAHDPDRSHFTSRAGEGEPGISEEILASGIATLVIGGGHPAWAGSGTPEHGYVSKLWYDRLVRGATDWVFVERRRGIDGSESLASGIEGLDPDSGGRLMGLFGGADGAFETPVPTGDGTGTVLPVTRENPTLAEASGIALDFLSRDAEGFFLLIEQGDIDWACHRNDYRRLIGAMWDLETAVRRVIQYIDTSSVLDPENTLVLLTADHATGFLRLSEEQPPGLGELPALPGRGLSRQLPGGGAVFGCTEHTNELVCLHGRIPDRLLPLLESMEGTPPAPGGRMLDNTHIFSLILGAADLEVPVSHVILIVGDGMGPAQEIAAGRYLYGSADGLAWRDAGLFPYSNLCTTWDIETYDRYAACAGAPPYAPEGYDPILGYDPERGGWEPLRGEDAYFLTPL